MTKLSELNSFELKKFLDEMQKTPFLYRDTLNFDSENISIGTEIEVENVKLKNIEKYLKEYPNWEIKQDTSLRNGLEIVSPVFYNTKKDWQTLKKILVELKREKANFYYHAASHFHIGAHVLGADLSSWKQFLFFYAYYEDVIMRFFYGERIRERTTAKTYAAPLASLLCSYLDEIKNFQTNITLYDKLPLSRYYAINFLDARFSSLDKMLYHSTIEYRGPNGTCDERIWQNNINLGVFLILKARKNNKEWVHYYELLKKHPITDGRILFYKYIHLKKALEFCDILFENDLDKIYFLKQYLKNYEEEKTLSFSKKIIF